MAETSTAGSGAPAPSKPTVRVVQDGRLVWYRERADEEYWHEHFSRTVTESELRRARDLPLAANDVGRILARVVPRSGKVLEAGCGSGFWVSALVGHGYDVEGIEYSKKLVDELHELDPELPVRQGDATHVDCADGTYRTYLSFGVVEHRVEGPEPFLAEAFRVLAPGGIAVITVPAFGPVRRLRGRLRRYATDPSDLPFYQYGYRPPEIAGFVAAAGFVVDELVMHNLQRMLVEELASYRWLTRQRGASRIKALAARLLGSRDGHMVAVIAHKP